jgi:hypothetical protein
MANKAKKFTVQLPNVNNPGEWEATKIFNTEDEALQFLYQYTHIHIVWTNKPSVARSLIVEE